jgi:protein-tyrosine phosphatase
MTRVWERLFVGSLREADSLAASNPQDITTVISLCDEEVRSKRQSINYLRFQIDDARPIQAGQFESVIDAIAENVRWGTVLIHCVGGSSRSPIMAAAWMHAVGYKDIEAALVEIGKRRMIDPSPFLLKRVKQLL